MTSQAKVSSNRNQTGRGKVLESAILTSQSHLIAIAKIPSGVRYVGGEKMANAFGKSRFVPRTAPVKSPCDFMGCVVGTGRAMAFEAKVCDLAKGFRINNDDHFPPHQREFIECMGRAGALAGVLVEATQIAEFLWLDWEYLSPHDHCSWPVVPWAHLAWRRLGVTTHAVRFDRLLGIGGVA